IGGFFRRARLAHRGSAARRWIRRALMRNIPLLATMFVLGGLVLPHVQIGWRMPASAADPAPAARATAPAVALPRPALPTAEVYARAAQEVYRSVVNVDTLQRVRELDFPFDDSPAEAESEGSGVVIDGQGYILTNQ